MKRHNHRVPRAVNSVCAAVRLVATFVMTALIVSPSLAAAQPVPGQSINAQLGAVIPQPLSVEQTGKTYGAWSAAWWQYVEAQPASAGPLADSTGQTCAVGQSAASPVFFLVGLTGSGTVERPQCVVPAGKALFFPLLNVFDTHVPGDGLNTPCWRLDFATIVRQRWAMTIRRGDDIGGAPHFREAGMNGGGGDGGDHGGVSADGRCVGRTPMARCG